MLYVLDYFLNFIILYTIITLGWRLKPRKGIIPKGVSLSIVIFAAFISGKFEDYYIFAGAVFLVLSLCVLFKCKLPKLFLLSAGLVVFTTMVDLMSSIIIEAIMMKIRVPEDYWAWGMELTYLISISLYSLVYHFVIKRNETYLDQIRMIYKIAILAQSVVFYIMISFLYDSLYRDISLSYVELYSILLFCLLGVFYSTGVVLKLAVEREKLDRVNRQLMFDLDCRRKQFSFLREKTETLRAFRHDLINHLITISDLLNKEDISGSRSYVDDLLEFTVKNKCGYLLGNDTVDAMVNYYAFVAKDLGVEFCVEGEIKRSLRMEDIDVGVVFGNLLKNAVEASVGVEKARIEVLINVKPAGLFVMVSNVVREGASKNKKCISTKTDGGDHGLGLKNVRTIVNKYKGTFTYGFMEDRDVFEVKAYLKV